MDRGGKDAWATAIAQLAQWHSRRDRVAGRGALAFIEVELRRRMPASFARQLGASGVDDAIQGVLRVLLERPLRSDLERPADYVSRMLRNRCLTVLDQAKREEPDEEIIGQERDPTLPADERLDEQMRFTRVRHALDRLPLGDRVALKLEYAPESLSPDELAWLGERSGRGADWAKAQVTAAEDPFALLILFDPSAASATEEGGRRRHMETFRKRRERARGKLRELLGEGW